MNKGNNYKAFSQNGPDTEALHTRHRWHLPGGAVQRGGRAAGEVLLDALVVSDLGGNWDGGGFSPWGHHGSLSRGGLRLPAGKKGAQVGLAGPLKAAAAAPIYAGHLRGCQHL